LPIKIEIIILHHIFMRRDKKKYSFFQLASAILMILALLWLTVSLPFVYESQQEIARQDNKSEISTPLTPTEEESANPFGSNSEEKAPNSSVSEEYLHDHHKSDHFLSIASQFHKCENAGIYIAFHGELLVPPPNAS
jgi:hypothetical protein